jgi:hypothetical protein
MPRCWQNSALFCGLAENGIEAATTPGRFGGQDRITESSFCSMDVLHFFNAPRIDKTRPEKIQSLAKMTILSKFGLISCYFMETMRHMAIESQVDSILVIFSLP